MEADITTLSCPPESLAEVRTHHLFEHFERAQALALLVRWYAWLRPGGRLTVETPDFEACVSGYRDRSIAEQSLLLRHVFGSQEAPWAAHRDGWSAARFRYVLGALGFDEIVVLTGSSDERGLLQNVVAHARRPSADRIDRREQQSAALALLRQSMNGENPTEERLYARWQARFAELLSDRGGAQ